MKTYTITLTVNGETTTLAVPADRTLLQLLKGNLHADGTKEGCGIGECGACTVILNGKAIRSCIVRMDSEQVQGGEIETIEGLAREGKLHPLQASFVEQGAVQCGFCTPGMIMSAKALLGENPKPSTAETQIWLTRHRNICRCTGYTKIIESISAASEVMQGEKS